MASKRKRAGEPTQADYDQPIWDRRTLAAYLGVAADTIDVWAKKGLAPRGFKIGANTSSVRYRRSVVMAWIAAEEEKRDREVREELEQARIQAKHDERYQEKNERITRRVGGQIMPLETIAFADDKGTK